MLSAYGTVQITPERNGNRGYTTFSVGIAGAQSLWGLNVSHTGAVRNVASGSVAAISLAQPQVRSTVNSFP